MKKHLLILFATLLMISTESVAQNNYDINSIINIYSLSQQYGINTGIIAVSRSGNNSDIDMDQGADIWGGGKNEPGFQVYTLTDQPTAVIVGIMSTSDEDSVGGTGALIICIEGLDENYESYTEDVIMTGTDTVYTIGTFIRVNKMRVTSGGSSGNNVGTINATDPSGLIVAVIDAITNQSLMAYYTIPSGYTGYLYSHYASVNKKNNVSADVELQVRPFGEVYQTKFHKGLISGGTSLYRSNLLVPIIITEKSDIKMYAEVSQNNADISAGFDLLILKN